MSETQKTTAKKLDAAIAKMTDRGRERLLDISNGYLMGYNDRSGRDGLQWQESAAQVQRQ